MSVFLDPDVVLLPALRPEATVPFAVLMRDLRRRQRIGPEDARGLAAAFLEAQLDGPDPRTLPAPVARWTFDEGAGGTAPDTGDPGGSTGPLVGPQWTTGATGTSALAFDGIDDRVSVEWSAALKNVTNHFTISMWAHPESPHEIDQQSASTTSLSGTSGQRYAFGPVQGRTNWGTAEHAGVGISVGTNGVSVYEHSDNYMPAVLVYPQPVSGWTHIAVVYDDRKPRLYINGMDVKSQGSGAFRDRRI
jgi:hypothetical protein